MGSQYLRTGVHNTPRQAEAITCECVEKKDVAFLCVPDLSGFTEGPQKTVLCDVYLCVCVLQNWCVLCMVLCGWEWNFVEKS